MANWYMGDGSLYKNKKKYKNKIYEYWQIAFCVNSFNENEINFLINKLYKLGFNFTKSKKKDGWMIYLNKQKDINKFLKFV